jgi:hypothetical protein
MESFIDRLMAAIVRSSIKALSEPGVMQGLVDSAVGCLRPKLVQAAKPNEDDDAFIKNAQSDGWLSGASAS